MEAPAVPVIGSEQGGHNSDLLEEAMTMMDNVMPPPAPPLPGNVNNGMAWEVASELMASAATNNNYG